MDHNQFDNMLSNTMSSMEFDSDSPPSASNSSSRRGLSSVSSMLNTINLGHPNEQNDGKNGNQPTDVVEGLYNAYESLYREFNTAATTIVCVPMQSYERDGTTGAMKSIIKAVPVAILRPMIGATEAISKVLDGAINSIDENAPIEHKNKYKRIN